MDFNILQTISSLTSSNKLTQEENIAITHLCDQFFQLKQQNSDLVSNLSKLQSQFLHQNIKIEQTSSPHKFQPSNQSPMPKQPKSPIIPTKPLPQQITSPQFDFAPITQKFTFDPSEFDFNEPEPVLKTSGSQPLTSTQIQKYQQFDPSEFAILTSEKLQLLKENEASSMLASQQMERAAVAEAEIRMLKDQILLHESDGLRSQLKEISQQGVENLQFLEDLLM